MHPQPLRAILFRLLARVLQVLNGVVEGELVGDIEHASLLGRLQAEVEESLSEEPEGRR